MARTSGIRGGGPRPPVPDQTAAERRRAVALELAIKAAPLTLAIGEKVNGKQLMTEAEHIETWLKGATT